MISPDQSAELTWRDDIIPVSTRFDDPYFSLGGGLAETRHVFLAGNDLPARFAPGFHVAELGFGTGLNLLATLMASGGAALRYTSFEAYPMAATDMVSTFEMAKYDKARRDLQKIPAKLNPEELARNYLEQAGFLRTDIDRIQPQLQAAEKNSTLERQTKGMPAPNAWTK